MGYIPNNKAEVRYVDNNILLRHISDSLKNGHKAVLRIKGESMYPFLRNTRDLVVLKTPCANELKPGPYFCPMGRTVYFTSFDKDKKR